MTIGKRSLTASRKPTIVLLGQVSKLPAPGVVWQTAHYLLGFERLGYDVRYLEAHARIPTTLMTSPDDDTSLLAADFIARTMDRFGFGDRWAFHALHDDGRCYGMSLAALQRLYRSADLIINLHGGTTPLEEHAQTGRLIYLETDPVRIEVKLAEGHRETIDFLEPHVAFFTFAENFGTPGCGLPVTDRFEFRPTRQPIVLDLWERPGPPPAGSFRTIGNWQQPWFDIRLNEELYTWSKQQEFLRFIELPSLTGQDFEPALSKVDEPDRRLLEQHGWKVRDPVALSLDRDIDAYRSFIHGARGEFSVAKDQNVRLRTGWFSDRSATFLASGLPVVVQDTAFDCALPTGEGLFGFLTLEQAGESVAAVSADPERHGRAALQIAREHFSHEIVLGRLLGELGMRLPGKSARPAGAQPPFPSSLVVTPVSRNPTELHPSTTATVSNRSVPQTPARRIGSKPRASVVVVTHDGLAFDRMCLESVLHADAPAVELIVVDNASDDETRSYLIELRRRNPTVRLIFNSDNASFATAVNQGLEVATAALLVILNNDTLVTPGWLQGLERHLADPSVGIVSPVTNHAPNEAEIDVPYTTYGELLDFVRDRRHTHRGHVAELSVATMFCIALRANVYEAIGRLDERFEVGLFEDDDYTLRVRTAGLGVICAEDVFVHHFGKGSFRSPGEYQALHDANRRRFEEKWGRSWQGHARRYSPEWEALVADVRGLVAEHLPSDAVVLIISRGDESLLELGTRTARHFPSDETGRHLGWYPTDAAEAIELLEVQRRGGATHLMLPRTELWWLEHYAQLREHLEARELAKSPAGVLYTLDGENRWQ